MTTEIWVNIGSGNGLLPDGTKPLPEPMLNSDLPGANELNYRCVIGEGWLLQVDLSQCSLRDQLHHLKV